MKKIIVRLFVLVLIVPRLAGCGKKGTDNIEVNTEIGTEIVSDYGMTEVDSQAEKETNSEVSSETTSEFASEPEPAPAPSAPTYDEYGGYYESVTSRWGYYCIGEYRFTIHDVNELNNEKKQWYKMYAEAGIGNVVQSGTNEYGGREFSIMYYRAIGDTSGGEDVYKKLEEHAKALGYVRYTHDMMSIGHGGYMGDNNLYCSTSFYWYTIEELYEKFGITDGGYSFCYDFIDYFCPLTTTNVYKLPSLTSEVLYTFDANTAVELTRDGVGYDGDKEIGWYKVVYDGVNTGYVKYDIDKKGTTYTTLSFWIKSEMPETYTPITTINVYERPGVNEKVVYILEADEEVTVHAVSDSENGSVWYHISYDNGKEGYIHIGLNI